MSVRSQTAGPQDIYPKRDSRYIPSFNNTLKEGYQLYISVFFLLNSKVSRDYYFY
jgi:hypothetical protein